jgi:hypothetical protein
MSKLLDWSQGLRKKREEDEEELAEPCRSILSWSFLLRGSFQPRWSPFRRLLQYRKLTPRVSGNGPRPPHTLSK